MKTIVLTMLTAVLFCTSAYAQTEQDYIELVREALKMEKKAAVIGIITLTDDESGAFWELYNEFNYELYKVNNKRVAVIMDFANNYENMTNEKADEIWSASQAYKQDLLKLQKKYYPQFKKILPAAKAVRYFQLENKIESLINCGLAYGIPMLEEE